jgi:hypothetical protein
MKLFTLFCVLALSWSTHARTQRFDGLPCGQQQEQIQSAGFELAQCRDYYNGPEYPGFSADDLTDVMRICTCNRRSTDAHCGVIGGYEHAEPYGISHVASPNKLIADYEIIGYQLNLMNPDQVVIFVEGREDPISLPNTRDLARSLRNSSNYNLVTDLSNLESYYDRDILRYNDIDICLSSIAQRNARVLNTNTDQNQSMDDLRTLLTIKNFMDQHGINKNISRIADGRTQYKDILDVLTSGSNEIPEGELSQYQSMTAIEGVGAEIYCLCDDGAETSGPGRQSLPLGEPGLIIDTGSPETLNLEDPIAVIVGPDPSRVPPSEEDEGDDRENKNDIPTTVNPGRVVVNPGNYDQDRLGFVNCGEKGEATSVPGAAQDAGWSAQVMNGNCWAVAFSNLLAVSGGDGLQKKRINPTHLAAQVNLYQCFDREDDYTFSCEQANGCHQLPQLVPNCLDKKDIGFNEQEPCSIMQNLRHDIEVCPNTRDYQSMRTSIGSLYYPSLNDLMNKYYQAHQLSRECGIQLLSDHLGLNAKPFGSILNCLDTQNAYKNLVGLHCLYQKSCEGEAISLSREAAQGLLTCQHLTNTEDTAAGIEAIHQSLDHGLPIGVTFCYSKLVKRDAPCPVKHAGVVLGRSVYEQDGQQKQAFLINPGFGSDLCHSLMANNQTDAEHVSCDVDADGNLTGHIWVSQEKLSDQNLQSTWTISSTALRDSKLYRDLTDDCPEGSVITNKGDENGELPGPREEVEWLDDDSDFDPVPGEITGGITGGS